MGRKELSGTREVLYILTGVISLLGLYLDSTLYFDWVT